MKDWPPTPVPTFDTAIFLDRDGTLNEDTCYPHRLEDLKILPKVFEALSALARLPVHVIAVTNQSGIALGLFTEVEMSRFNAAIRKAISTSNGRIDAFYYCPHREQQSKEEGCSCSKPSPGMLIEAADDFNIDLTKSYMIGDKESDVAAGRAAGCRTILVLNGKPRYSERAKESEPDLIVNDLSQAAEEIATDLTSRWP